MDQRLRATIATASSMVDPGGCVKAPRHLEPRRGDRGTRQGPEDFRDLHTDESLRATIVMDNTPKRTGVSASSPQGQGHHMVRPPGVLQIRGKVSVRSPLERFSSHFSPLHPLL